MYYPRVLLSVRSISRRDFIFLKGLVLHPNERKKERFFIVLIFCKLSFFHHRERMLFYAAINVGVRDFESHKYLIFCVLVFHIFSIFSPSFHSTFVIRCVPLPKIYHNFLLFFLASSPPFHLLAFSPPPHLHTTSSLPHRLLPSNLLPSPCGLTIYLLLPWIIGISWPSHLLPISLSPPLCCHTTSYPSPNHLLCNIGLGLKSAGPADFNPNW